MKVDVERYARDGAVLVPGVFQDWVAPLEAAVEAVIQGHRDGSDLPIMPGFEFQNDMTVIESFGGGAMALNIVAHHPEFQRWINESDAAELAAVAMQSRTSRFWVDASFRKEEGGADEGTPWHNDTCTWPFWGSQMTIVWIALSDIGMEDGPLQTVMGSHRGDGRYYSPFFPAADELPQPYKPWDDLMRMAETDEIETWTMQAGDALIFHPSVVHGSLPRASSAPAPRLSFSTRWLGDNATWRPDALTEPMTVKLNSHPDMRFGEPPPDHVMPVVWKSAAT